MPLVETDGLLNRFVELLDASTRVDIAVAWVGPGLAVEHVLELAENKEIRIVVGLSAPKAARCIEVLQPKSLPPSTAPIATGWSDSCRAGLEAR